ncbi:MAG: hypothetical protein RLZZ450_3590 [Pseudomonadota bacterium]|jgi:peptide/nickel transport system substrate-binding protein
MQQRCRPNFDRLAKPDNVLTSRASLGPYLRSEVLAKDQLKVTLAQPFTPFLRNLSMTKLCIVSPAAVQKHGKLYSLNPVGTGPFRFVSLKQGTEIKLVRNAAYAWAPTTAEHKGPAYLDALTFLNVPEESTRIAVLRSGQVQASDLIPPQNLAALRADKDYALLEKELLETNYSLQLNVLRTPWDDEDMRLAVRLSLDIETIVRVICQASFARAWSALSPSMFGSAERELARTWKPDPPRAAKIFDEKGWKVGADGVRAKDGKRLTIRFIDSQGNREKRLDVIQLVRRQLAVNGVYLTVDTQPAGTYTAQINNNEYDLVAGASFHADPDILRQSYVPEFRAALSGNKTVDPELIAWLNRASAEPDPRTRAELYLNVQKKIIAKTYAIPIYVLQYNLAASKHVHGLRIDSHGFPEFHGAWLDA